MGRRIVNESGKNKTAYIAFAIMSVLILLLGVLIYYLHNVRGNMQSITLTEHGIENTELKTDFGTLLPGESSEYTINFECKDVGAYKFSFFYTAKENSPLGKYVTVEVKNGEERKASGNLGELLSGNVLIATYTFEEATTGLLTVRYVMHEDVGDEAQGASLDFDLRLTVEKIG
ncbi:MAG: hypothetical protein J6B56_06380 [Clostridia bacterium]|nr:hypothetical protein [Clostridia bacterium]